MPARTTPRTRNRRGDGAALRRELLDAATARLDETGDPDEVTVRGVAGTVGVAPNAVYLHFADREAMLAELAIGRLEECTVAVRAAVEGIDDPLERLIAGHEAYCRLALDRPGFYRLLFRNAVRPRDTALAERMRAAGLAYFQVCVDGCRACIDAGAIDAPSPDALAASVWALQHGWCDLMLTGMGATLLGSPRAALDVLLGSARR